MPHLLPAAFQVGGFHFGALEHINAIDEALGPGVLSHALVNNNRSAVAMIKPEWNIEAVTDDNLGELSDKIDVVARDLVSDTNPLRHDPEKLTTALLEIARSNRGGV